MRRVSQRAIVAGTPLGVACACALVVAGAAQAQTSADLSELSARTEQAAELLKKAANDVLLVERQYSFVEEPSDEAAQLERFNDGETRHLLGDFATASVLFYDLVANKEFQKSPKYVDALYKLADSLYQLKNYLGARLYLRQLLDLRGRYYKEGLARYLEIASRLNFFVGVEDYITQARGLSGGVLPSELSYVYGKWMFTRDDLPVADRVPQALRVFQSLSTEASGRVRLQSQYFVGVAHVHLKQWDQAVEAFKAVGRLPAVDARERQVQELATLSLGRVYFETGKYDLALEQYAQITGRSENYPDSLYESAWCHVRAGEFLKAKETAELLLIIADGTVLAPEAQILKGTLLQKLQNYDEAIEAYNEVINEHAPVRDELEALITINRDPVAYFDDLLARNEKSLDVTKLLPPTALKWATARKDIGEAVAITTALDQSRRTLADSKDIAQRILQSLDERGVDSFPLLQEGYSRAAAVETTLTNAEEVLTEIEGKMVVHKLSPEQQQQLDAARATEKALKAKVETLPTTPEEVVARRRRIQAVINDLERQAFELSLEVQSQSAQLVAVQKYVEDTRPRRQGNKQLADDEKAFLERVANEKAAIEGTLAQIDDLRKQLAAELHTADKVVSGEDVIRKEYAQVLDQERAIYTQLRAGLPEESRRLLARVDVVRADAEALRDRVNVAKGIIRERVQRRAGKLREQILAEANLLDGYLADTDGLINETRNLVGRMAYDSFRRVHKSFYDLVLKADVGVVDVSFQRKQDKTSEIQTKSAAKERELKQLDDEFREVLKDVD